MGIHSWSGFFWALIVAMDMGYLYAIWRIKEILKVCLLNSDLFCDTIPKDRSHKINRRSYEA